jgi:hypothetical protein
MSIPARQRIFQVLGDTGCFLHAMVEVGQDCCGHYIDTLLVFLQAWECNYVNERCLVLQHRRLMELITGDQWEYRKEAADYQAQAGEFIVEEWQRKDIGVTYTHFIYVRDSGERVDPLGNSVTVAGGQRQSRRVFRMLPK